LFTYQPVEQVVLHFGEFHQGTDIPVGIRWLSQTADPLFRLSHTLRYLLTSQTTSVTVVDLDRVPLSALGLQNSPLAHPRERQLYLYGELGALGERLHFKTGDKYRAEVGTEQFRIETVKALWSA
jgi:hypothetical protein